MKVPISEQQKGKEILHQVRINREAQYWCKKLGVELD